MNRIPYALPQIEFPVPNQPWWAKDQAPVAQAQLDAKYHEALDHYYGQAEGWIQTQVVKRGNNAAYKPDPFLIAIPRRQLVAYDAATGKDLPDVWADVDPRIELPTLPPIPAPTDQTGIRMSGPTIDQMLASIMQKLVAIENRIAAASAAK